MESQKNSNLKSASIPTNLLLKVGLFLGVLIVFAYVVTGFLEAFEHLKFKPKPAFKNSLESATYGVLILVFTPVIMILEQRLGILRVILRLALSVVGRRLGGGVSSGKK